MEDDEDCYGFGALSDMFENRASSARALGGSNGVAPAARAAPEPKRLDLQAMSRFWWSERRLNEFRRGAQRHTKEYHHVAAKMDGTRIDGGLGSAFLVPRSREGEGGVLWLQAQASDSNAQAKRKKEFQDITNRQDALKTPKGSSKSTGTVFLRMSEILDATMTRAQNTVYGIKFTLRNGPQFEITFMPGPFFDMRNRDEMLEAFSRQQVDDVFSPESSPVPGRPTPTSTPQVLEVPQNDLPISRGSSRSSSPDVPFSRTSSREPTPRQSPLEDGARATRSARSAPAQNPESRREAHRALIRRYVQLDESSGEAIDIAQTIHASTSYEVGPVTMEYPNIRTNLPYRKQTLTALYQASTRMQSNMDACEKERIKHTRVRSAKLDMDYRYTDTSTDEALSLKEYQARYMKFVQATCPETHPVLRMCEPRIRPNHATNQREASVTEQASSTMTPNLGMSLFGINFSHSSLVDAAMLTKWQSMACPKHVEIAAWAEIVNEDVLSEAHNDLFRNLAESVRNISARPTGVSFSTVNMDKVPEEMNPDVHERRRSANRRRSIDQSSLEDLRSEFNRDDSTSTGDEGSPSYYKRRRSDGDASPTSGRRRRRQSLVATLDTASSFDVPHEEEKTEEYDSSTSAAIEPMDTICPLCCDADAVVVMEPCGHSVCRKCWGRLARAENASPPNGAIVKQCPWDREAVIER